MLRVTIHCTCVAYHWIHCTCVAYHWIHCTCVVACHNALPKLTLFTCKVFSSVPDYPVVLVEQQKKKKKMLRVRTCKHWAGWAAQPRGTPGASPQEHPLATALHRLDSTTPLELAMTSRSSATKDEAPPSELDRQRAKRLPSWRDRNRAQLPRTLSCWVSVFCRTLRNQRPSSRLDDRAQRHRKFSLSLSLPLSAHERKQLKARRFFFPFYSIVARISMNFWQAPAGASSLELETIDCAREGTFNKASRCSTGAVPAVGGFGAIFVCSVRSLIRCECGESQFFPFNSSISEPQPQSAISGLRPAPCP